MTRLAVEEAFPGDPRISVSDIHASGQVGYGTIDLVDHFRKQPGVVPYVVLGQELLGDLQKWKEEARLRSLAQFIVIRRPGAVATELPRGISATWLSFPYQAGVIISSTILREMLAKGVSCAGLLPPAVLGFCRSRGLYETQK
jgi:nicotinic acid mononucleotide adenylyltransferase